MCACVFCSLFSLPLSIARRLWRDYFSSGVDGIVFMVDSNDRERFPESRAELNALLSSEELVDVPILVFGNKIDIRTAASEEELRDALGLFETYGKDVSGERKTGVRPVEMYMCSVIRKTGYVDGFNWLSNFM